MALTPGTRLGSYEVMGSLGVGGMGEVYRARDTKLGRDVALKTLPEAFAQDAERLARFRREAQVLAALSHPNIAVIHGLEDTHDVRALVLELVDGPTLAEVIAQTAAAGGPPRGMELGDVIAIARQIAAALEGAHDQGIIHRDLKPANIKLRPDGVVKVLDFGLAKALDAQPTAQPSSLSMSPTITNIGMTGAGMILGTAAYMSPEQARGKAVDKRADIWAFGCVVFEMLTGRPPFEGSDVSEVMAGVIKSDVPWDLLPAATPPALRSLLGRCLEKDPRLRLRDIGDARFDADLTAVPPSMPAARARLMVRERLLWVAALVAAVAIAATLAFEGREAPVDAAEVRLQLVTERASTFNLSRDGRRLVFQARGQLWLREFGSETAEAVRGTEGGFAPFFSPDGESIGFFAGGQLKRVDLAGGVVRTLADGANNRGAVWNSDGTILFAPASTGPLYRVSAADGRIAEGTRLGPGQTGHRFPTFLPDDHHFLFFATGTNEAQGIYVGSLGSADVRKILDARSAPVFAPPDYVLFAREETLLAQQIRLDTFQPIGEPISVAPRVTIGPTFVGSVAVQASRTGTIAYRPDQGQRQFVWMDRSGRALGTVGAADDGQPTRARLAPDGKTFGVSRLARGNTDLWLVDARGLLTRFTTDAAIDYRVAWSPDGTRIAFNSDRNGELDDIYEKRLDNGLETKLLATPEYKGVHDWSPNGRLLVYSTQNQKTAQDLWILPMEGPERGKPYPIAQSAFSETNARFSPDNRWVVYQSDDTGRLEVYVQLVNGGKRVLVSSTGGRDPAWTADGRELLYADADNRLMALPVTTSDAAVRTGTAAPLFTLPAGAEFEATPDGQRFLVNMISRDVAPFTIILNWKPARR